MKKKILLLCLAVISVLSIFNFVNAEELMTVNIYSETEGNVSSTYKASEHEDVKLPFINSISGMKVVLDKDINHSGITISTKEIDVLSNLKGLHILYNQDSLTIKGKIGYPVIISQNVILEGEITGDAVIYSPNVVIKENAVVKGDILVSTDNLKIEGTVLGNVIASVTQECVVSGVIENELRISTTSLNVDEGKVNGKILVKTTSDMAKLLEKYPEAVVENIESDDTDTDVKNVIVTGTVVVLVFTVLGYVVVRKDENIFTRILNKVKGKSVNVVLSGIAVLLPSIVLVILLIILSILGLWIIGVPALLLYIAYIAVCAMLSILIIGTVIFEAIKYTVIKKYEENIMIKKLGLLFGIFAILYTLAVIPFISKYVIMTLCIISTGILTVAIVGKNK